MLFQLWLVGATVLPEREAVTTARPPPNNTQHNHTVSMMRTATPPSSRRQVTGEDLQIDVAPRGGRVDALHLRKGKIRVLSPP